MNVHLMLFNKITKGFFYELLTIFLRNSVENFL